MGLKELNRTSETRFTYLNKNVLYENLLGYYEMNQRQDDNYIYNQAYLYNPHFQGREENMLYMENASYYTSYYYMTPNGKYSVYFNGSSTLGYMSDMDISHFKGLTVDMIVRYNYSGRCLMSTNRHWFVFASRRIIDYNYSTGNYIYNQTPYLYNEWVHLIYVLPNALYNPIFDKNNIKTKIYLNLEEQPMETYGYYNYPHFTSRLQFGKVDVGYTYYFRGYVASLKIFYGDVGEDLKKHYLLNGFDGSIRSLKF